MPRTKIRRFDPTFGVSMLAVETEAKTFGREVENYQLLATNDLRERREKVYADSTRSWKEFQLHLESLSERNRIILHALLFRDMYFLLELCLAHLRISSPTSSVAISRGSKPVAPPDRFSEWLFTPHDKE